MKELLLEQEVVGMYYLVNKKISTSTLIIIGLSSYLLPLTNIIYLSLILLTFILGLFLLDKKSDRLIWTFSSLLGFILVLSNILAIPMFITILISILLVNVYRMLNYSILLILMLQLSFTQTLETLLSQHLLVYNLESLAPTIIASMLIFIFNYKKLIPALSNLILIVILSKLFKNYSPITYMIIIALPTLFYAVWINLHINIKKNLYLEFIILILFTSTWLFHLPRSTEKIYVLFPNIIDAYESKYFENYEKALKFSDINVIETKSFDNIPSNATILIPWVSDKIQNYDKLNKFAKDRNWTIILGGEHTNYNNIKIIINQITGYDLLSDDLTTPLNNSDYSGILRSNSLFSMPLKSIINRGASVQIPSLNSIVLLTADGWWSEPNINEWLWVGDYSWEYGDHRGRLPIAIHIQDQNANFIVIGDNSFFVNYHLISNNDAIKSFMSLSTLWPLFIHDFLILLFILSIPVVIKKYETNFFKIIILYILIMYLITYIIYPNKKSQSWKDYYIGEESYDVKNFNKKFAKFPELWDSEYRLFRFSSLKNGIIDIESKKNMLFMEVENEVSIGDVKLSNCKRLGSLDLKNVFIMDGQVCKVKGKGYKILLGDEQGAISLIIKDGEKENIILLDKAFLSEKAPDKNIEWLLKVYNTEE